MRQSKVVLVMAAAVVGLAGAAWAEGDVSVEVTADFFSKYVWRGHNVTDDWSFQPGVSATYGGFTAGIWGAVDLTDENDEEFEFIEYDWYADYSGQINETIGYSVGLIYYYFPSVDPSSTTEVYGGLNFDVIANPSVTVYYDVDEADGAYVSLGVGHTIEDDSLPCAIDLGASLGWGDSSYNDFYWGTDGGELNDLVLSAAFPFEVGPVSVTPSVNYVAVLGSDTSDAAGDDDSLFYAGVGFAYGF